MTAATKWLTAEVVNAIHDRGIEQYGGIPGELREGAIEGVLARVMYRFVYAEDPSAPNLIDIAAFYAFAIATGHPYNKGNKRTAGIAMVVFLDMNGYRLTADQKDFEETMLAVAAQEIDYPALTAWLADKIAPLVV